MENFYCRVLLSNSACIDLDQFEVNEERRAYSAKAAHFPPRDEHLAKTKLSGRRTSVAHDAQLKTFLSEITNGGDRLENIDLVSPEDDWLCRSYGQQYR
jgi:hypothetical protein